MLRQHLCDYGDESIVVKEKIDLLAAAANEDEKVENEISSENNVLFRSCISNINSTLIENE